MVEEDSDSDERWDPGKDFVFDAIPNLQVPEYDDDNELVEINKEKDVSDSVAADIFDHTSDTDSEPEGNGPRTRSRRKLKSKNH